MDVMKTPEQFMKQAISLAEEALAIGEFPIAAVIVLDGKIIARGMASEHRERRFLGHAELVALEQADRLGLALSERRRAALFTTLEPCLMCMGAAMSFFLGEICYALESHGDGAVHLVQTWVRQEADIPGYRIPRISAGLLREESVRWFELYIARRAPGPMRDWAESLVRRGE